MAFPTVRSNTGVLCIIYTKDAGGKYPVHGAYKVADGEWVPCSWTAEGYKVGAHRIAPLDITGEIHRIKNEGKSQAETEVNLQIGA